MEAVRVLVGLKHLAGKHPSEALEEACRVALSHGAYRLRTIRQLLAASRARSNGSSSFSKSIRSFVL